MDAVRRRRLEELPGWSWDPITDQWEDGFSRLSEFSQRAGNCRVPQGYKTENGFRLGTWVRAQRTRRDEMDPQRRRRLEQLPGWSWNTLTDQWNDGFSRLREFSDRERHCRVPRNYETDDGYRLGQWVGVQRANGDEMDPQRRRRLEELPGWSWDPLSEQWEDGFSRLKEFSEREGHCRVPQKHKTVEGYTLGGWVIKQRTNRSKMDTVRRRRLEQLPGWSWDPFSARWEDGFARLKEFSERKRHCRVPQKHKTEDGYRLGQWVGVQRANRDEMEPERRRRLEELPGWSWDPITDQWEDGFSRLSEFSQRERHCRVPADYKTEDDFRLGGWVGGQRANRDEMDPQRRRRLEELPGWSWDPLSEQWEDGFSRLKEFSEREGHCRVPKAYTTEDGYHLGYWVNQQRTSRDKSDPERRRRLEKLPGWVWRIRFVNRIGSSWDEMYGRLMVFQRANGHCRVPKNYETDDGYRLGRWIGFQRARRDEMDPERRRRLEELPGWLWKARD